MSEFEDFCNKWMRIYITDFENPYIKSTDNSYFIFMRKGQKDRTCTIPIHPKVKEYFQKIIDKHSPQMYLLVFLSWVKSSKNTHIRLADDPNKKEMVMFIGKTMNGKEEFTKAFKIKVLWKSKIITKIVI